MTMNTMENCSLFAGKMISFDNNAMLETHVSDLISLFSYITNINCIIALTVFNVILQTLSCIASNIYHLSTLGSFTW